jgi:hypothetical protein
MRGVSYADRALRALSAPLRFAERLGRVLRFDRRVYADLREDRGALLQASAVVAIAGLARGLGSFAKEGSPGLLGGTLVGIAIWPIAAAAVWLVAATVTGRRADFGALLRALGFASAPLFLLALLAVPVAALRLPIWLLAHVAAIAAFALAVREALAAGTGVALLVCVLALALGFAALFLLGPLS